jgi:hypothetical protein
MVNHCMEAQLAERLGLRPIRCWHLPTGPIPLSISVLTSCFTNIKSRFRVFFECNGNLVCSIERRSTHPLKSHG